jgi:hypothetical protein
MRWRPMGWAGLALGLALALASCNPQDILGDCQIVRDNVAGSYGPNDTRSHTFQVDCAGTITVFWTCPQCADPDAGRLTLLDPTGNEAFTLFGAGFGGNSDSETTVFEGTWTLLIRGTGGNFVNNYSVDVTYPAR